MSEDTSPDISGHAGPARVPRHVAIIMDGNGRWATARGLPRVEGHRRGVESLRRTVSAAIEMGIGWLTVYSFSSENWRRPVEEIEALFGLLRRFIRKDLADLHARGVRVRVIGSRDRVPVDIVRMLEEAERLTETNPGLTLVVAFNYGARDELVRVARALARDAAAGRLDASAIDEDLVASRLDTAGIPDPDLVIRTSGELRLSNFLLWQSAYSEFVFMPDLWPDFGAEQLRAAIEEYAARERRFGGRSVRAG